MPNGDQVMLVTDGELSIQAVLTKEAVNKAYVAICSCYKLNFLKSLFVHYAKTLYYYWYIYYWTCIQWSLLKYWMEWNKERNKTS